MYCGIVDEGHEELICVQPLTQEGTEVVKSVTQHKSVDSGLRNVAACAET